MLQASTPSPKPAPGEKWGDFLILFTYLRPHRAKFLAALLCLVISSLVALAYPLATGSLIDGAMHSKPGPAGNMLRWTGGLSLNRVAWLLMLLTTIQAAASYGQSWWLAQVGERSIAAIRLDAFGRIIRLPMAFFNRHRVGELASRITTDLGQLQSALSGALPQLLGQIVSVSGGLILITMTSPRLTLVMLSSVPPVVGLAVMAGRRIRKMAKQTQDKVAANNVLVDETFQGIGVVKGFTNEGFEISRYQHRLLDSVTSSLHVAKQQAGFGAFATLGGFGSLVLVMWYGAKLIESGELSVGRLTQFMLYTMFIAGGIGHFARTFSEMQRLRGATQRIREMLRETPEVDSDHAAEMPRIAGELEFTGVAFTYPTRPEIQVLKGISLRASAGQRIALVGPSGAGKSTVVAMILRFYEPDSGVVRIDGRNAREYPLGALRKQIAMVPQEVLLFGGTIAENIAYGRPGATQAEIESAAQQANAHDFITSFPDGYATIVGERGTALSGGQRQRVAIARAILRDPAILILDEATSSLDPESEQLVQQALERLMVGRTSVIIAHRLSTIRQADQIYVLGEGRVVEAGTHAELAARPGGLYQIMTEIQFGH